MRRRMRLLRARELQPMPGERVFRHSRLGPLVLWCAFAAPLAFLVQASGTVLATLRELPWYAWLVLGPFVLGVGALYALPLAFLAATAQRAFGPSNWLVRVAPDGLALNLRSYQNAHFPDDAPSVLWLDWSELACVREARDVTPVEDSRETPGRTRWLELELAPGTETTALADAVRHERERRGPERRRLGITSRSRSGHVPVFVPEPGRVHVDWLGHALLGELARHAIRAERRTLDRRSRAGAPLEERLLELVRRGDGLAAIRLLRDEERLSLLEAKQRLDSLSRRAA